MILNLNSSVGVCEALLVHKACSDVLAVNTTPLYFYRDWESLNSACKSRRHIAMTASILEAEEHCDVGY